MKIKKTPAEIWHEYGKCVQYNENINLYKTVEDNEDFYNGKHWKNLKAPSLDKPVFNFIKEAVNLYISTLISDDIGMSVVVANPVNDIDQVVPDIVKAELDRIMERANVKSKNRKAIRNCAVDGDMCMYFYFDPDIETGFKYKGEIECEIVDNTNVLFADPSTEEVEKQPYIILAFRKLVAAVKDEAEENGQPTDTIMPDSDSNYMNADRDTDSDYVTVLLKFWKEDGKVRFMKTTRTAVIKEETETGLTLYPVTYMSWEAEKNSYHGISPITAVKPNQIFVNKLYAMAMEYTKKMAFPKLLYDRTKIPNFTNEIGKAVAVAGNPNDALFSNFQGADMSSQVMQIIESTISQTKEQMGAYDAALGNVNPDNTSAIIATQQAAAAPLDIQRLNFYNFIEAYLRIWIDMMSVYYGKRYVTIDDIGSVEFDFKKLKNYCLNLKLDIGKANQWSDVLETQTIDSLIQMGVFSGDMGAAEMILEAIPRNNLRSKERLMRLVQARKQEQEMMMQQQMAMEQEAAMAEQGVMPDTALASGNVKGEQEMSNNAIVDAANALSQLDPTDQAEVLESMGVSPADRQRIVNSMS